MKCVRCHEDNPSHAKFCLECGTPFAPGRETDPRAPSREDLRHALTEALEQQAATAEILRVISSSPTDVQPVFDTIVRSGLRLLRGYSASMMLLRDGDWLDLVAYTSTSAEADASLVDVFPLPLRSLPPGERAVHDRRPHAVEDVESDPDVTPVMRETGRARGWHSNLFIPMIRGDVALGLISITRRDPGPFSGAEIALVQTFADQAVIAIENVRLFTELQENNRSLTEALDRQRATAEILQIISTSPTDLRPVLDAVVERAARLCAANDGVIFRADGDTLTPVATCGVPGVSSVPRTRGTASGRAIVDRQPVHVEDIASPASIAEFPDANASRARGIRTQLAVPLLREREAVGVILIRRFQVQPFSEQQIALLRTFADQAVIAIENVRLFTELETRNRDLTQALDQQTATGDILRVISTSPVDVQPIFEAIACNSLRLCGGLMAAVFQFDGELMHIGALHGFSADGEEATRRTFPTRPERRMIAARAVLSRAMVHVPDVAADPEFGYGALAATAGWRSLLVVPMLRGGEVLGTVGVARAQIGPFRDQEIALLQTFADQAVIAIENARLFNELKARTQELTRSVDQLKALGEVGRAVSSTLDLETVLTTIVSHAVQLAELDGGVVFEYDPAAEEFVHRAATETGGTLAAARRATRVRKGEGVVGQTATTLEPAQLPDITVRGAYESRLRENLIASGIRAILAVPMLSEGRLVGCLVVSRNEPGEFPVETIDLLRTFATQSALAIQNARLFEEIASKSRQLEAASRHKSEFLANMSHELRTPLNAVIGFSEVLLQRMFGDLNVKQDEYLKDIYASGQHLLSLINDILDLSKIEAGRMELAPAPFHLPTALENAVTLVKERAARHAIALHVDVDPRLGEVVADERKVKQVLLNLLSNAVKFTHEGGRIGLKAGRRDGMVEIAVTDTGIGIAAEDQAAIFEEFRQVGSDERRKQEGTGLGLTLAKKFVELHGGRIWVESQVGQGATFTFTLPVRLEGVAGRT